MDLRLSLAARCYRRVRGESQRLEARLRNPFRLDRTSRSNSSCRLFTWPSVCVKLLWGSAYSRSPDLLSSVVFVDVSEVA